MDCAGVYFVIVAWRVQDRVLASPNLYFGLLTSLLLLEHDSFMFIGI